MGIITIEVPKSEWLSANDRPHWAVKARKTKALRTRAFFLARSDRLEVSTPAKLRIEVGYQRGGRADPENAQPTCKALIDGMVDAGVLPDDDSAHIVSTEYRRGEKCATGWYRIRFVFEEEES